MQGFAPFIDFGYGWWQHFSITRANDQNRSSKGEIPKKVIQKLFFPVSEVLDPIVHLLALFCRPFIPLSCLRSLDGSHVVRCFVGTPKIRLTSCHELAWGLGHLTPGHYPKTPPRKMQKTLLKLKLLHRPIRRGKSPGKCPGINIRIPLA